MRVLLLTDALPDLPRGGADLHLRELATELEARGLDVDVHAVAGTRSDAIGAFGAPGTRLRRSFANASACRDVAALIEAQSPDVLHLHSVRGLHFQLPELARAAGVRTVWTHHDLFSICQRSHLRTGDGQACDGPAGGRRSGLKCGECFGGMARLLGPAVFPLRTSALRGALAACDVHIAPSAWVAEQLLAHGADPASVHGVSTSGRAPERPAHPPGDGPPRFVFAGDLRSDKGADLVVAAAARVTTELTVDVHGGQPAPPAPREAAFQRMLQIAVDRSDGRVHLHGRYEPGDLAGFLDGATALIAPSRVRETFGRTANEALLAGVPVVAADHGGLAEQVVDGINGALFEPGDITSLAAAMDRVLAAGGGLRREDRWPTRPRLLASVDALARLYEGAR